MHSLLCDRHNNKLDLVLVWMSLKHVSGGHTSPEHRRDKNSVEVNLINKLHSILALSDSKFVNWWVYQILPYLELCQNSRQF